MLQSLRILFKRPTRISFIGTVTKVPFRSSVTWLPFCLTLTKPNLSQRILTSSLPSTGLRRGKGLPQELVSYYCELPCGLLPNNGQMQIQRPLEIPLCFSKSSADRVHAESRTHYGVGSIILFYNLSLDVFQLQSQTVATHIMEYSRRL